MGYWKNKVFQEQGLYEWARNFLCEVGALKECDIHGAFFEGPADVEDAYRAFNQRVTSGRIVLEKGKTRRQRTDLLKAVYDNNSAAGGCPECERNFGQD